MIIFIIPFVMKSAMNYSICGHYKYFKFLLVGRAQNLFQVFLICYKGMHKYPTNIDQSRFAIIAPILESSYKTTSHRSSNI